MRLLWLLLLPALAFGQGLPHGANNSLPEGAPNPPDNPPVWNNTPAPVYNEGQAASYDLLQDVSDPDGDPLTFVNEAGCTLPTGVSIDNTNKELDEDGTSPVATTTNCVFSADDGTNAPVDSSAFSIVVQAIAGAGTIYERDLLGSPRAGSMGANEPNASPPDFPVAELNDVLAIDYTDTQWACDDTILVAEGDWSGVDWSSNDVICLQAGDHGAKGDLILDTSGSIDAVDSISAITMTNPVRVDFTAVHGWADNDIVWCNTSIGGTWQMRRRWFVVDVIDTDTADLLGQDGTGTGLRPAWAAYTSGGGCQKVNFKVLRHATDLTANPATLAEGSKAKVRRFELGQSGVGNTISYIMTMGITCDHDGLKAAIGTTCVRHYGSDWVIYDRFEFQNDDALTDITADNIQDIIRVSGGSDAEDEIHNVQMQRSVCHEPGAGDEQSWFQITDESSGIRLTNNESQDCKYSVTLVPGVHAGLTISESSIYSTKDYHSDCDGNVTETDQNNFGADSVGTCKAFEGPLEFKGGHSSSRLAAVTDANRHDLIVVDANVHSAERLEDIILGKASDGTSGNISFGFSANTNDKHSFLFRNNVEIDTGGDGIPTGPSACNTVTGLVNNYNSVLGNLNYNIGGVTWNHFTCSADDFDFHEYQHNSIVNAADWLFRASVENTTWECNLLIDAGTRTYNLATGSAQKNNYGYGDTTQLDGSGDTDGGATSNAIMDDWTINPMIHLNPSFTYVLTDVLTTGSSPHEAACSAIGTASRGVTDSTVTY